MAEMLVKLIAKVMLSKGFRLRPRRTDQVLEHKVIQSAAVLVACI